MRRALAAALIASALTCAALAIAATAVTKHQIGSVAIAAGATRTLSVPYPDALEYGNARYSGSHHLIRKPGARGSAADLAKVRILEAQSVQGGSLYQVRAHNANATGSAPITLVVTATTVEPLPHRGHRLSRRRRR